MSNYFDNFYNWWKNIDKYILFIILGLFFLGLFFSLVSTSLIASDKLNTNPKRAYNDKDPLGSELNVSRKSSAAKDQFLILRLLSALQNLARKVNLLDSNLFMKLVNL